MSRQLRTLPQGTGDKLVPIVGAASSGGPIQISNYGATDLTGATTGAEYVLDAPSEGVRKTLFRTSSGANDAVVIRMSTGATVKVGNQLATQITFNATTDLSMSLIGLNSTRWVITAAYPSIAANTTGAVIATS